MGTIYHYNFDDVIATTSPTESVEPLAPSSTHLINPTDNTIWFKTKDNIWRQMFEEILSSGNWKDWDGTLDGFMTTILTSTDRPFFISVDKIDETRVIIVYKLESSGYVSILNIENKIITVINQVLFDTTIYFPKVIVLNDTQFVIAYKRTTSYRGYICLCTYNNLNEITINSNTQFEYNTIDNFDICKISDNEIVGVYDLYSGHNGNLFRININNNTIVIDNKMQISTYCYHARLSKLNNSTVFLIFSFAAPALKEIRYSLITVNNNILSYTTPLVLETADSSSYLLYNLLTVQIMDNKIFISYDSSYNSIVSKIIVIGNYINQNVIFGDKVVIFNDYTSCIFNKVDNSNIIMIYRLDSSPIIYGSILEINDTSIINHTDISLVDNSEIGYFHLDIINLTDTTSILLYNTTVTDIFGKILSIST